MAEAEPGMKGQIAISPDTICELCEDNEITWKCCTCEQYICDHCRKIHLRERTNRKHRVAVVSEFQEQKCDTRCWTHPYRDVSSFCIECDIQICTACITMNSHKHHTIFKINDEIREEKKELSVVIEESAHILSEFQKCKKAFIDLDLKQSNGIAKCYRVVVSKYNDLTGNLDLIYKEDSIRLEQLKTKNLESLEKTERSIASDISELMKMIKQCKENQALRGVALIQLVQNAKQKLKQFKPHPPTDVIDVPVFVSSNVDEGKVEDLFGDLVINKVKWSKYVGSAPAMPLSPTMNVRKGPKFKGPVPVMPIPPTINISEGPKYQGPVSAMSIAPTINVSKGPEYGGPVLATTIATTINVKVVSSFNMYTNNVTAVNANQAWVILTGTSFDYKTIKLVTLDGKVSKKVTTDFDVYDLGVTNKGKLLATMFSGNKVKKLTSGGRFVDLYEDQDRAFTRGITVTNENDIIVCLHSRKTNTEEGHLAQLTSTGQLKTTIKYDRDGKTLLFADPRRVSSNRNNDIIVADKDKVVVVDKSGNKRFIYAGQVKGLKKLFNPAYTVTDQYGHIIISDMNNSTVHLLDEDGNFIQFILSAEHGLQNPNGLSVDKAGRLWVGTGGNKKIMVVKYV